MKIQFIFKNPFDIENKSYLRINFVRIKFTINAQIKIIIKSKKYLKYI